MLLNLFHKKKNIQKRKKSLLKQTIALYFIFYFSNIKYTINIVKHNILTRTKPLFQHREASSANFDNDFAFELHFDGLMNGMLLREHPVLLCIFIRDARRKKKIRDNAPAKECAN